MKSGEVWRVKFPFEDNITQFKIRPCVVLDVDKLEVLSVKVTTHEPRDEYDVPIFKWQQANLLEPCFARVSKTALIKKDDFIKQIGELNVIDYKNIVKKFIEYNS